ncbi:MAG: hypothetical protein BA863_07730 [Desulfovibrio sp. S3730MH75]|nr:MAG: hypothetical protein BA863_07730 [Desulfovibrio sp. S3730MH75]
MKTKSFIRKRKKLLEDVLRKIFKVYEVNKDLKWGLPDGTHEERKRKAEEDIHSDDPENIKEFIRSSYKVDVKFDAPTRKDLPKELVLAVFEALFCEASLITGEELRAKISEEWLDKNHITADDYSPCGEECDKNKLDRTPENQEKMRLKLHREKVFPYPNKLYVQYSPEVNLGLGENCFNTQNLILCEVSEEILSEFNGIIGALVESMKQEQDLRLETNGSRIDKREKPDPINPNVSTIGARSVYYSVEELFLIQKDINNWQEFSSHFEYKLYEFIKGDASFCSTLSGTWSNFAEFIVSVFITYFYYSKNFNHFCLCNWCDKLYLPEKLSKSKNRYCCDKCRKANHRAEDEVSCYNRQYAWFKNKERKVREFIWATNYTHDEAKKIDPISQKEICSGGNCPHKSFPAGGGCDLFSNRNPQIRLMLTKIDEEKKNK